MKSKILFVMCLLFGLMFINAGVNKFLNYMPMPDDIPENVMNMFIAMTQIGWLLPLIAVAEIVGGIFFMIPKFRALGAVIIFPVMIGILLTHITVAPSGLPLALVLFGVLIWIIVENREKYKPMIDSKITIKKSKL